MRHSLATCLTALTLLSSSPAAAGAPEPDSDQPGVVGDGRNALFPMAWGLTTPADRTPVEVQIHVGVRFRVAAYRGWSLHAFYKQLSIWDAYNFEASSPFRENNYGPGAFFRAPRWRDEWTADLGYWHESNGLARNADDRSWDRIFFRPMWERGEWRSSLTVWWRVPKPEAVFNDDVPIPDGNPDIYDYQGIAQWEGRWTRPGGFGASAQARLNPLTRKGALDLEVSYPLSSFFVAVRYFDGYGESLVDYSRHVRRLSVGILLTR